MAMRFPGSTDLTRRYQELRDGTLNRQMSSPPGPLRVMGDMLPGETRSEISAKENNSRNGSWSTDSYFVFNLEALEKFRTTGGYSGNLSDAKTLLRAMKDFGITVRESSNFYYNCLLYTSPSPRDATLSRMPSSA